MSDTINQTLNGRDEWSGPYTATIAHDKSVSDNCGSGINKKEAFKPYSDKEEVEIRVRYRYETVQFKTKVHTVDHSTFATFPIAQRRELDVTPGAEITFWVCQRQSETNEQDSQRVAIKPGSNRYHYANNDGETFCNHAKYKGKNQTNMIYADVVDIGDGWKLCEFCEDQKYGKELTRRELIDMIRLLIGVERDSGTFNNDEFITIANELAGSDKAFKNAVKEVLQ